MVDNPIPVKKSSTPDWYMAGEHAGTEGDPSESIVIAKGPGDVALATAAKQDTIKTAIDAITTKLSADPATQTTLAAILAKLIAAPATEAGQQPPATAGTHDSIALTAANTEYSLVIPAGCKKLTFRTVQADGKTPGDDLLYAFVTGKVDHPTLYEHMLLDGGAVYTESNLNLSSKTLYVAGITAGDIVLLEMWS